MRRLRWVWLGLGGAAAGACLPTTSHQCETAAQCGPDGTCEPGGACSFPAADCPGGRRYGEGTGPLAGQCVADGGADAADPDGPPAVDAALDATPLVPWSDGHHGDLTIGLAQARLNSYGIVVVDAAAGATTLTVLRTSGANVGAWNDDFVAGDRVVVWRTTGLADLPSGGASPVTVDGEVGRWFATRVTAVGGGQLQLAAPLPFAVPALGSQVVKVPDLATLTVPAGRTVLAEDWRGSWGGVIVVAAEAIVLDGRLAADGAGLRGGQAEDFGNFTDCVALDGRSPGGGGAAKGESLVPSRYGSNGPAAGRGNLLHGGGGGNCRNAGGGGGGGAGRGGAGGHDLGGREVGGLGGAALVHDPDTHLVAGGGGGAGEANGSANGHGGAGGGVVLVVARTVTCAGGELSARGADGRSPSATDGGGAGGGGGTIWLQAERVEGCALRADGGAGALAPTHPGAGGGGGGGRVILTGAVSGVTTSVAGGPPGPDGVGALPGAPGLVLQR